MALTFFFLTIIMGTTDQRAPAGFAPIAIGLGLTLIHLIGIPVTNVSVDPARSTVCDEKSFHHVANRRDGRIIVSFSRSRKKFPLSVKKEISLPTPAILPFNPRSPQAQRKHRVNEG